MITINRTSGEWCVGRQAGQHLLFTLSLPEDKFELPDGKMKVVKGCALLVTRHQALRF